MTLIYCYDAYCGWCYGFSPVMRQLAETWNDRLNIEVLSGGMILPDTPQPISVTASYISQAYKTVEEHTGITFGQDYLWHIFNPQLSDWFPHSEKPAIALCVLKDEFPDKAVSFAADLQHALHVEGRDLTDDEAYRHLLPVYGLTEELFYGRLHSEAYKDKAHYEFALVKQLQVTSFPQLLLQASESKFYLVAKGFTPFETVSERIGNILSGIQQAG